MRENIKVIPGKSAALLQKYGLFLYEPKVLHFKGLGGGGGGGWGGGGVGGWWFILCVVELGKSLEASLRGEGMNNRSQM